jgi:uncharacterized protein (TIGR02611 family)
MQPARDQTAHRSAEHADDAAAGGRQGPYRTARRIGVAIVGSTVLLVGIILLVTPGPAFVVIPIGLGILALEFKWAARWRDKIKDKVKQALPARQQKDHPA